MLTNSLLSVLQRELFRNKHISDLFNNFYYYLTFLTNDAFKKDQIDLWSCMHMMSDNNIHVLYSYLYSTSCS